MYKQIIFLTLLTTAINANMAGWRNCGSHLAIVHNIRVSGCLQTPCSFVRGNTYVIEVDATALANSINLPFAMTATALGIPIPIPLLEGNACENLLHGSCPALNGESFTWSINYTVTNILPPVPALVTSILWNDYGDQAICIEVDGIVN